jgi:GNAT superfamily N-acetyltransferase
MAATIVPLASREQLEGMMAVQRACYPEEYIEAMGTYEHRSATYPAGHFVALDGAGAVVGYAQAFPWVAETLPVCDVDAGCFAATVAEALALGPGHPRVVFHVHDISCAPAAQGRGVATALMRAVLDAAARAGYARAQLVAVMGMEAVWGKPAYGFAAPPPGDERAHPDAAGLEGYAYRGRPAVYMTRSLAGWGTAVVGGGGSPASQPPPAPPPPS